MKKLLQILTLTMSIPLLAPEASTQTATPKVDIANIVAGQQDSVDTVISELTVLMLALKNAGPQKNPTKENTKIIADALHKAIIEIDTNIALFDRYRDYFYDSSQVKSLLKLRIEFAKLQISLTNILTGHKTWLESQVKSNWRKPIEATLILGLAVASYYKIIASEPKN